MIDHQNMLGGWPYEVLILIELANNNNKIKDMGW